MILILTIIIIEIIIITIINRKQEKQFKKWNQAQVTVLGYSIVALLKEQFDNGHNCKRCIACDPAMNKDYHDIKKINKRIVNVIFSL